MASDDVLVTKKFNDLDEPLVGTPGLGNVSFEKESPLPPSTPLPAPTKCYKRRVRICGKAFSIWRFRRSTDTLAFVLLVLGLFFFILAFSLSALITSLLKDGIAASLSVEDKHTDSYDAFVTNGGGSDTPIHYDIYMFDVVNVNDVMCNGPGGPYDPAREPCPGAVPELVERGPYAYKKCWNRIDISWRNHGEIISFIEQDYYKWDDVRAGPGLSETDMLTMPSLASNLVKVMLEGGAESLGSNEIRTGAYDIANRFRDHALTSKEFGTYQEIEHAAQSIEKLGDVISNALTENPMNGDGWRLLLKLILCTAPPAGPSQFHTRPMKDLYWGYWGDPLLKVLGTIIVATGEDFVTYLPGFATNYSTPEAARRQSYGKTEVHSGKNIQKIHEYVTYMNMKDYYICLSPDYSTGSEVDQIPAVCPQFQVDWTQDEAATNGYFPPWHSPDEVPITGKSDCNGFQPFHGEEYPGAGVPSHYTHEERDVFISDISRSFPLKHTSTLEWRGVKLSRLEIRQKDMASANCSWAWPEDACNPDNAQFDAFGPSGMLNMTTLSGGVQIFASKPHFLDGHPWLVEQFGGALHPQDNIHQTFLDVEPFTGYPLRIAERLQLVIKVDNWNLPSVRLYDYFGWDPEVEKQYVEKGLEKAFIIVRDVGAQAIEKTIENKLFGDGGYCDTSEANHLQHCAQMAIKLENFIYSKLEQFCTGTYVPSSLPSIHPIPAPTSVPSSLSTALPTSLPSSIPTPIPSAIPTALPTSAPTAPPAVPARRLSESIPNLESTNYPIPTLPSFNDTGKDLLCDVIDWTWDNIIDDHKVAALIQQGREICAANPATCEQFETLIRDQVEGWVSDKCDGNVDPATSVECKLGKLAAKGASSVFEITANFCNSGVCDAVAEVIEFLNGTSFEDAKNKKCLHLRNQRAENCILIDEFVTDFIATECNNKTVHISDKISITAQVICNITREIVFENDFDDVEKNDDFWGDDPLALNHGVYWKKADAFCSSGIKAHGNCKLARKIALDEIDTLCSDAGNEQLCAVGQYIINNWEHIDNRIMNATSHYNEWCESDLCSRFGIDSISDGIIQQEITSKLLLFCNVSSFVSNDILPPAPFSEHPWRHLAKACPTIVNEVSEAIESYCTDESNPAHSIECNIIKSIPWDVPIDENGGPILSFIEDTVVPTIENDIDTLKAWCHNETNGQLPEWHADVCNAVKPFLAEEFVDIFNAAISALDDMVPQFNISGVVTTAEEFLVCASGEAISPGIDNEGYYFPMAWADEWMEVPHDDTLIIKKDVYSTQMLAHQIEVSFLIIAGCFGALACFVFLVKKYTKSDYAAEDRLLHRELVARKDLGNDPFDFSPLANDLDEDDEDIINPLTASSSNHGKIGNAWV